jgi:hypothetical protein
LDATPNGVLWFLVTSGKFQGNLGYLGGKLLGRPEQGFVDHLVLVAKTQTFRDETLRFLREFDRKHGGFASAGDANRNRPEPESARLRGRKQRVDRHILGMAAEDRECRNPIDWQRNAKPCLGLFDELGVHEQAQSEIRYRGRVLQTLEQPFEDETVVGD